MKNDLIINTSKRIPVLLCLDVSPSMSLHHRMDDLNNAIRLLYQELSKDVRVANAVDLAIVTFSTEVTASDFETLDILEDKVFEPVEEGGTNLSEAVLTAIAMLESRTAELRNYQIPYYLPFFILVTDGNPDQDDQDDMEREQLNRAVQAVRRHCEWSEGADNLIAPYIIGVGEEVVEEILNRFASQFTGQAIILGDEARQRDLFRDLFLFIGNSVRFSVGANVRDLKGLYQKIQKDTMRKVKSVLIHNRDNPVS